jgi:hypothetical protein
MMLFPADSFFVDFFFQFLTSFEVLSFFSVPTAESIVFGNKSNDYGQDSKEFTCNCLFTSVSFTMNHNPASSLFADEFQESKTKSSQSVAVQGNNFFDFS